MARGAALALAFALAFATAPALALALALGAISTGVDGNGKLVPAAGA